MMSFRRTRGATKPAEDASIRTAEIRRIRVDQRAIGMHNSPQINADAADLRESRRQEPFRKNKDFLLRVRARISWHSGASAGQADARRRDAGDVVISSRSGNAADTRLSPPRPAAK